MSKLLIISGALLIVLGILWHFNLLNFLKFLGHLPGDIYYKKGNASIIIPITTCLILSAIVSLLLMLFRKR